MDFSPQAVNRLKQALMTGLANNPAPEPYGALTSLALVAARSRYVRSRPPSHRLEKREKPIDRASLLPDAARHALLRLLSGKDAKSSDTIAAAALHAMKGAGLRLHPFDYSRLEDFIADFADELGTEERRWLRGVRPERAQVESVDERDVITEQTLAQAGRAQKLAFLMDLRRRDPAKARGLIEKLLPEEPAKTRAELVGVLATALSDADSAVLEGLGTDRAQSVRDQAQMLLARIPGTSAYHKKLELARDRIVVKKGGLLRRRAVLSLRSMPSHTGAHPPLETVESSEVFYGLRLSDLASTLKISVEDLIAGSAESEGLGHLVLRSAVLEGLSIDLELFGPLFAGDAGHSMVFLLKEIAPHASGTQRGALLALGLSPENWSALPAPIYLHEAYGLLREPLSLQLAKSIIQSKIWRDALQDGSDQERMQWAEAMAPLIPRSLSEDFLRDVETHSRRAALYHRFLLSLPDQSP